MANIETLTDLDSPVNYELVKGLREVSCGGAVAALAYRLPGTQPESPHLRKARFKGELMSCKRPYLILLLVCFILAGCSSLESEAGPVKVFRFDSSAAHGPDERRMPLEPTRLPWE